MSRIGLASGFFAIGLGTLLVLASPLRAASDPGPLVPSALKADPSGWEDVMPPADLKGWFRVPIPSTAQLGRAQWHVKNGRLICDGDGGHDMLMLDRKLRNCIFHVEFRFTKIEGRTGYNSGVFIRNTRDGAIWHQAQVGSLGGGNWFGVTPNGAATRAFNLPENGVQVKEAGQWNTFELTARGQDLSLWVNGRLATPFTECGQAEGYAALEGEGWLITFRNLKLKILP